LSVLLEDGTPIDGVAPVAIRGREGLLLSARDDEAGTASFTISIDDGPFQPAPEVLRFERSGPHTVGLRAVDRVGNVAGSFVRVVVSELP
jgi:hypothetical protein